MEIQGTDGSKIQLNPNSTTIFGRLNLSNPKDLSISRHHISINPIPTLNSPTNPRVSFQVVGKNPVWMYNKNDRYGKKIKTFNRFQKGELGFDDLFCVSGKNHVWFNLINVKNDDLGKFDGKSLEICDNFGVELSQSLEGNENCDFGLDYFDVSNIDPVQEFGFLVIGHEFDQYPKKIIREIKNWDWFLYDPIRGTDDDDGDDDDDDESEETKGKTRSTRKRKKTNGDDDENEEWTAECEGEELATKVSRPKYHTRSKDPSMSHNKQINRATSSKASSKEEEDKAYDDEDDEEDQTLGGFIVNDETVEEGHEDEENVIDYDDEEEFVEDEEDELEE